MTNNNLLKAVIKSLVMEEKRVVSEDDFKSTSTKSIYSSNNSSIDGEAGDTTDGSSYNTMGLRLPTGPMGGRSVKEFEEQLISLRKENFNLKLRIYFLEEKMGTNFTLDKDNAIKKNIELQIEVENLKKELKVKHDLLCQAAKAMELEDEEHKKYIANKEEELQMCQQELEDLRLHIHETKLDFDGMSVKSDTTGFYSGRGLNSGTLNGELQERVRILEAELQLEKENNASLQLVIGQTESIRSRYEKLLKDFQGQEQILKELREEIEAANEKLKCSSDELRNFKEKLTASQQENQQLHKEIQSENRRFEECMQQLDGLRKKYSAAKAELEREQKRNERMKMVNEMRITELESENAKNRDKIKELRGKLDAAAEEIKRNQSIAVAKSSDENAIKSNTDVRYLSASDSATPSRITKEESLHVQISKSSPSTVMRSSSTPEKLNIGELEKFMLAINDDKNKNLFASACGGSNFKIISQQFDALKNDNATQRNKIISLKSEQMKACNLIKKMIDKQKINQKETTKMQQELEQLKQELELKHSKRMCEEGDAATSSAAGIPLKKLITNKNIEAIKTSCDNEKSSLEKSQSNIDDYKALIVALEEKIDVLVATLREKDAQLELLSKHSQVESEKSLEEDKENLLGDIESIKPQRPREMDTSGRENRNSVIFFYKKEIEEKDREIEKLKVELKKSTSYLQEIVNKELWEKNKEIEKMHNKQVNSPEIIRLKKDLSGKDLQLKLLKEKISELGIDFSIPTATLTKEDSKSCCCQLTIMKENNTDYLETITNLEEDIKKLKSEVERSEKLRHEANQVCSLLNSRLEELAIFLDSLLKQKSILGYLGIHKERRLRDIISTSLDLSKSFTMSMMYNPDQSLTQLTNITNILNGSKFQEFTLLSQDQSQQEEYEDDEESTDIDNHTNNNKAAATALSILPNNITLTYQSHLHLDEHTNSEPNKENVIAALRQQIINLKNELQLRDNELNRINSLCDTGSEIKNKNAVGKYTNKFQTTSTITLKMQEKNVECHSESESWSEPDRVISRARIGLNATYPLCTRVKKEMMTDSTEEDSSTSLALPPILKKSDGKNHQNIHILNQHILELQQEVEQKAQQLATMETKLSGLVNREMFEDLSNRYKELELRLQATDEKKQEMEMLVEALRKNVDDLTSKKKYLEETLSEKDKESQNIINELQMEKDAAIKLVKQMEEQLHDSHEQYLEAERKRDQIRDEMIEFEKNIKAEYHEFSVAKIKDVEERCSIQLSELELKHREQIEQLKSEYAQNYVCKEEVKDKLTKLDQLIEQLDELKCIVQNYEGTVDRHKKHEEVLQNRLKDREEEIQNLTSELDSITQLKCTIDLEHVKLSNEKLMLEDEISKYQIRDVNMTEQMNNIKCELDNVKLDFEQQISNLLKQKSKLEVKISELESTNADLYNKLIRLQATNNSSNNSLNSSMPNIGSRTIPFKKSYLQRQYSDQLYSSEDNGTDDQLLGDIKSAGPARERSDIGDCIRGGPPAQQQAAELVRMEANSSPDLGIESDHGRFSSLETNVVIGRPLLPTLQVTESMSNLLDAQTNRITGNSCDGEYCCQRTMDIVNENSDLKRQLLRMRRALEETASQLNLANQRKKQVEKTICKQIHKTSQVLRKAKANLDSGSESDLVTKKVDT